MFFQNTVKQLFFPNQIFVTYLTVYQILRPQIKCKKEFLWEKAINLFSG